MQNGFSIRVRRRRRTIFWPLQSDRAGDPEFDFLLGNSALQLGKNTEAVFALERVLAVKPDSTPARALIARAYFNLKETETARREFENVKQQDLPPDVAATVNRFLDATALAQDETRLTLRGFLETSLGYDSNVNSATSDSQVAVPGLGGAIFSLSNSSQELGDAYLGMAVGLALRRPLAPSWSLHGGWMFSRKGNFDESDFSTYYHDLDLGVSYKVAREIFTRDEKGKKGEGEAKVEERE